MEKKTLLKRETKLEHIKINNFTVKKKKKKIKNFSKTLTNKIATNIRIFYLPQINKSY